MVLNKLSKTKREQRNRPDSDHQYCKCNGIVIEPMSTLYTHDGLTLLTQATKLAILVPVQRAGRWLFPHLSHQKACRFKLISALYRQGTDYNRFF